MIDFIREADDEKDFLKQFYEDLHAHPESGNQEYRTTDRIVRVLSDLGYSIRRPYATGCIADLAGNGDVMTAFRADIDALPIREETGVPYASVNDLMHACGHDLHAGALVGAAVLLKNHQAELPGKIRLIFQMDEEGEGGAERMIRAGALDGVSHIFGCHINPSLPTGRCGIRYGRFYAAAMKFDLTVKGKSAHGAEPEKGIDALYAGAVLSQRLKELTGLYDGTRCVVNVGTFHAGQVRNILCDEACLSGIIRTPGLDLRRLLKDRFVAIVRQVEKETGTGIEVNLVEGYPGVENEPVSTAYVEQEARAVLGDQEVEILTEPTMTTEDFGCYLMKVPGCFFHMGVGSPYPLHNSRMCPDERALPILSGLEASLLFHAADNIR
jgi:amidohydrolase